MLRNAAEELEALATESRGHKLGTLRKNARAIVASALAFADGSTLEE